MTQELTHFAKFMLSLAGAAQIQLGIMPDPQTNKTNRNLNGAKEMIDILEMLKEKTKGNLTNDEAELFDNVLYELRMIYVEECKKK